jgi:hypothetical protein
MKTYKNCICCNKPGDCTISLAAGSNSVDRTEPDYLGVEDVTTRWYLPNDRVRQPISGISNLVEVAFCKSCMRNIEDNFRANILSLQCENGMVVPVPGNKKLKVYQEYEDDM